MHKRSAGSQSRPRRASPQGRLTILVLVVWQAAIVLSNAESISLDARVFLNQVKMGAPLCLVLLLGRQLVLHRCALSPRLLGVFGVGMIFSVVSLFPLLLSQPVAPLVVGFHFAWPVVAYLALPFLLNSSDIWRRAVLWNTVAGSLLTGCIVLTGLVVGPVGKVFRLYTGRPKLAPGFMNPNHYANELAVLAMGAVVLLVLARTRAERNLWILLAVACGVGIYLSGSRSAMVFIAVFLPVFGLLWARKTLVLGVLIPATAIAGLGFLVWQEANLEAMASGRLGLWTQHLQSRVEQNSLVTILFGGEIQDILFQRFGSQNPLIAEMGAEKLRVYTDNTYLSMFLQYGIVGFASFVLPILMLLRGVWTDATQAKRPLFSVLAIAGLVSLCLQSVVTTTVPTFANPSAFAFLVFFVPALFLRAHSVPAPERMPAIHGRVPRQQPIRRARGPGFATASRPQ